MAKKKQKTTRPRISEKRLREMLEEAIVDCYGEDEQAMGLFTMIQDSLACPFQTTVLGVEVTMEAVDITDDNRIVAICARGGKRQRIPMCDLPLPSPPPEGAEWIEVYRLWASYTT